VAARSSDEGAPFTVLFVCTGNICRSPLAERVTEAYLAAALGPEASAIRLRSAGTRAVVGSGVHPDSAAVLTALGGDARGFAARQLTEEIACEADLTLALTREHRRSALKRAPRGLARTFTLVEAADLASRIPFATVLPGETFPDRCRSLVREMAAGRGRRSSDARDDIPDPVGRDAEVHQDVGQVIADGIVRLFGRLTDLSSTHRLADRRVEAPMPEFLGRY
jgi:protein-tyrosine-phosphatase